MTTTAIGAESTTIAPPALSDRIVAVVNDAPVTLFELNQRATVLARENKTTVTPAFKSQVLELLIAQRAQVQRAQQEGIVIAERDVDAAEATVARNNRLSIEALHEEGVCIVMLTGDSETTAHAVDIRLALDEVVAGVLPEQKAAAVKALQDAGHTVGMAGDGINDAAALTVADVGLAMGAGSQIALESADIVLVRDDLVDAVSALQLGQATMSRIRGNLLWAFGYNVIGIPLAMGLLLPWTGWLLPPAFAAAAMSMSSVSVVSNSLLLKWWKPLQN